MKYVKRRHKTRKSSTFFQENIYAAISFAVPLGPLDIVKNKLTAEVYESIVDD